MFISLFPDVTNKNLRTKIVGFGESFYSGVYMPISDPWISFVTLSSLGHTVASPHGPCNPFVTSIGLWVQPDTIWEHSITAKGQPMWGPTVVFGEE